MKLKIGDRVRIIYEPKYSGLVGDKVTVGMTGTVKALSDDYAGVEFDDYINGHNGHWDGKLGYCWYVAYERLEKIEDTEEETKEEAEEMKKEVNEETKTGTFEQKILKTLREEIGVDIGEEFDVYKNGNMQWRCKFDKNGFSRKGIYEFQKSGIWKDIIGNFSMYTFKRKPFIPTFFEEYFHLDVGEFDGELTASADVKVATWEGDNWDYGMLALGNVFRSEEQALGNKDKLLEKMEKLRKGEV